MKHVFAIFFFFYSLSSTCSQHEIFKDWHLGVSYYGNNLVNPGAQITGQKVFYERTKTKVKKDESVKLKHQQFLLDANLGFFYDNPTYFAIFNNYNIQYRGVRKKGKYSSTGVGIGFARTILPETLIVSSGGQVTQVNYPGNWYLTPNIVVGTGRLWKRNGTYPWRLQFHMLILTNYNLGIIPLLNIEYGYLFGYSSKEKPADEF